MDVRDFRLDDHRPAEFRVAYRYGYLRSAVDSFLRHGDHARLAERRADIRWIERAERVSFAVWQCAIAERRARG